MGNQLIINACSFETRVALLENGQVSEFFLERSAERGLIGNIYLGRVQRVLPGMQAAFVELGLERAAFLYVADALPPRVPDLEESEEEAQAAQSRRRRPEVKISDILKPGQEILVQVVKEPIGTKGPRVSCSISIPGRHVVFMANFDHVGISRKITDEAEKTRLRKILSDNKLPGNGYVARTVSQGISEEKLRSDCDFLKSLWQDVEKRAKCLKAPYLIQPELDLVLKCARDMTKGNLEKIIIDNQEDYERFVQFLEILEPSQVAKVEQYQNSLPIFEHFGIESSLDKAMGRKVWLRSGGYLVLDEAEALTVIDVNTGRYVGKKNLEDTILKTNIEAAKEVAYQLRLRNVGGMVIIDFIDMLSEANKERVLGTLNDSLAKDRARCNVVKISELGLVEMTRQRIRESLGRSLCEPCYYCEGKGNIKSKRTIAYEIFRKVRQLAPTFLEPVLVVHAHPEVVDLICGAEKTQLQALEKTLGKEIVLRPRGSFHQEHYDLFSNQKKNNDS